MVRRDDSWSGPISSGICTEPAAAIPRRRWPQVIDLVLVIDVQGARQVRQRIRMRSASSCCRRRTRSLAERLRGRNQDPPASIERRLATARAEVDAVDEDDYVVINDELERCVARDCAASSRPSARVAREQAMIDLI